MQLVFGHSSILQSNRYDSNNLLRNFDGSFNVQSRHGTFLSFNLICNKYEKYLFVIEYFLAIPAHWFRYVITDSKLFTWTVECSTLLLFRKTSYRKLWENARLFIRIGLVRAPNFNAEVFHYNSCERARTPSLPRIQRFVLKVGNFYPSKYQL